MAGIVVVFDFDKTIIDLDSDNWVVDELGATDLFNQLLPTMPWNSLMDKMMKELHSQGKTIKDIEEVLKRAPVIPRVVPAVKAAHALGCDLRIVSDANVFYIETILKHLGIYDCFTEINTNPGYVDEEGKLRILPHHDFHTCSHGCTYDTCPPNMCKTIIDLDSDNWVVDELGATDLFNQLLPTMPWNSLMDRVMKEVHSQGKTIEDIEKVLKRVPVIPRFVPAIKAAHALGCDLRIVSDANVFYIETILKHLGIHDCFTEIHTNPGYIDEEGKLRILPHHDFHTCSHGCSYNTCPPNMCKGVVIERIQASLAKEGKKRIIYLGDGAGDFCPSLKLKEQDFVMPRKDFPVWNLINENRNLVRAEIHGWTDGEEQQHILLQIIKAITIEENQFLSVDCKFQTIPVNEVHEAMLKALPVPY